MEHREKLRPEQEIALRYLRRKGTEAPLGEIRDKVATTFRRFDERLLTISAEDARRAVAGGGWCVQEIVDHLAVSHRPAVGELRMLLQGSSPAEPVPAGLQSLDPMASSWEETRQSLARVSGDYLEVLATAEEGYTTEARSPIVMVVKTKMPDGERRPIEWLHHLDWKAHPIALRAHVLEHLQQIARVLET